MRNLPIKKIRRDSDIQQRVGDLSTARVREYAKAMRAGADFPAIDIFFDGQEYLLSDGFHRCAAAEEIGREDIKVHIYEGSRREAILHAVGANATHGLRRKNADKRKAVFTLLGDMEWRQWSDREIARLTHTTQPFVSKLRRSMMDSHNMTWRKGADGRRTDTRNIGHSKPLQQLERAWQKASEGEKQRWLEEHRGEIETLQESALIDGIEKMTL